MKKELFGIDFANFIDTTWLVAQIILSGVFWVLLIIVIIFIVLFLNNSK